MAVKVDVLGLDGKKIKQIEVPSTFTTVFRLDLIRRAVIACQANRKQPQGRDPLAGTRNTAVSQGSGHGRARVPRIRGGGTKRVDQGAFIPGTVGGRAAFPPKSCKKIHEKINKKERRLAIKSAIAATANLDLVRFRGHKFEENIKLPIVVSDELENISKTSEVIEILKILGVYPDIIRASKKKIRPGKGKMRGRKYKRKKSLLIVISNLKKDILKGARNIQGVDVSFVDYLNAELLAPGGHPGRLVIWTESAFKRLK
ncbi:MAG: 50S ribosomal protein L4 [Candidatus Helarchaeota archaeon]